MDKRRIKHVLSTRLPTYIRSTKDYWKVLLKLMSSPPSPETSLPSGDSIDAEVYADELAQIMGDPLSLAQIVNAFDNDPTGTAILQLFHFISDTMDRTRQEMTRLRNEREEVYEYAIASAHFRQMIQPIVRDHREQQNHRSPSPSPLQPLFDEHSPLAVHISPPSISDIDDSPQTIPILSPEPIDTDSPHSESPSMAFFTATENTPGTQQNPINIDQLVLRHDTPHPAVSLLRRTNSNPILERAIAILQNTRSESSLNLIHCRVCDRYGHRATGCVQMGALVCQYCREVGHGERDCNVRRRDERRFHPEMQFCLVCSQPGHSIGNCYALQYPPQ